ncbi:helix-turn-helix domain-containing protein [Geodermatophilus sp. SYSU D01105]
MSGTGETPGRAGIDVPPAAGGWTAPGSTWSPPSMDGYRIADIAAHWGFASQAHSTRLFRERFGRTPSEVRAARSTR